MKWVPRTDKKILNYNDRAIFPRKNKTNWHIYRIYLEPEYLNCRSNYSLKTELVFRDLIFDLHIKLVSRDHIFDPQIKFVISGY